MSAPALAAIVGVDDGAGDNEGRGCMEIAAEAAVHALDDAGLTLGDVDALLAAYAWEEPSLMFGSEVAGYLGLSPDYVETVCFGGASPAMMVARAARAIAAGACSVAVLAVASNRRSRIGGAATAAALRDVLDRRFEVPYGALLPPVYALAATRFMHDTGTTADQFAAVATTQRAYAAAHPGAYRREPLTIGDVSASPVIASPLRALDCCLVTDFGGAIVVVAGDRADAGAQAPVWLRGYGEAHGLISSSEASSLVARGARRSATRALDDAGVQVSEIGFAEIYDSFTVTVLATLEDIGLSEPGSAGARAAAGAFAADGELPVNTNGGMLSYRTGGLSHVVEAVHQLRGTAPGVRLPAPELGLVHGIGGVLSEHCTLVLGRDPT